MALHPVIGRTPTLAPAEPTVSPSQGRDRADNDVPLPKRSEHRVTAENWPLVAALNTEWTELSYRPAAAPDGTPWAHAAAALDGMETLADVLEAIATSSRSRIDQILHALLVLHAAGDELAGRTVLQTMLGRVVRSKPTGRKYQIVHSEAECVAAQWEMIATYPLHRTTSVAGNLALGALNILLLSVPQLPEYETSRTPSEANEAAAGIYSPTSVWTNSRFVDLYGDPLDSMDATNQILQTLRWAKETEALTKPEIELLVRVHLHDDTSACLAEAGAAMGLTYPATRQRYSRILRKLRLAVQASLEHPLAS